MVLPKVFRNTSYFVETERLHNQPLPYLLPKVRRSVRMLVCVLQTWCMVHIFLSCFIIACYASASLCMEILFYTEVFWFIFTIPSDLLLT